MDILGIGPLELLVILIILLVVMGPKDIVKSSRVVGKFLRQIMTSPTFRLVQDTSREIRNLPYRLARESGIEELQADLKKYTDVPKISPFPEETEGPDLGAWGKPAKDSSPVGENPSQPEEGSGTPGEPVEETGGPTPTEHELGRESEPDEAN